MKIIDKFTYEAGIITGNNTCAADDFMFDTVYIFMQIKTCLWDGLCRWCLLFGQNKATHVVSKQTLFFLPQVVFVPFWNFGLNIDAKS